MLDHVRIHFIIVMIRWTGLAPSEFECPFEGSLTSTFLMIKGETLIHFLVDSLTRAIFACWTTTLAMT